MGIKPENASEQKWVWRPTAILTWDDEHGFSMTLDFGDSFDYMAHECEHFDEAVEWGVEGLEKYLQSDPHHPDWVTSLFEKFKPRSPEYRTAEDFRQEFMQLLQQDPSKNEATGGQ